MPPVGPPGLPPQNTSTGHPSNPSGDSPADPGWQTGSGGQWNSWGSGGYYNRYQEFSVDRRMWADKNAPMDLQVNPLGYKLWEQAACLRCFMRMQD